MTSHGWRKQSTPIYEYYNCWIAPYLYPGTGNRMRLAGLARTARQGVLRHVWVFAYQVCMAAGLWSPTIHWEAVVRDFVFVTTAMWGNGG
jgi:hypothetical protein